MDHVTDIYPIDHDCLQGWVNLAPARVMMASYVGKHANNGDWGIKDQSCNDYAMLGSHTAGWVDNSCNYSSIGLVGKVDPEAGAFAGQVNDTGGACSTFAAFVEPAPETFEVEVLGDWWGEENDGAGCSLQVSVDGVRLELGDADVAQERNASQGVTLDQLASALSTMDDGDVDEDDVLSILIKLILAESEALEFPLSGESGRVAWEVLESSDSIHLKFKVRDND